MFVCGSHLLPSFRTSQASVLARLAKRFKLPAKGSLGHNLVTLVKFQDPPRMCWPLICKKTVQQFQVPHFVTSRLNEQMFTEIFTWRFNFKDQISIFW